MMQTHTADRPLVHNAGRPLPMSASFEGALELFDHGHIRTGFHARLFKTGLLCLPGREPEYVAIRFFGFTFNAMQDRDDAVYSVIVDGQPSGEYFASAFKNLWL